MIDVYSIKPIDAETIRAAARDTGAIVTVEDHWPEGGLGDAVLEALAEEQPHPLVVKLAVREMPGSGTPAELLHAAGIDARRSPTRRASSSRGPAPGMPPRSAPVGANRWERPR